MQKISPFLWFDDNAEEAMKFYTSVFNNSKITEIHRYPTDEQIGPVPNMGGKVLHGIFELEGQRFMALDGGPMFKFTPAISFFVACSSEDEINTLWEKLSANGSVLMELNEYPFSKKYGWCADKYGVTWQLSVAESTQKITPAFLFVGDQFGKVNEALDFYTSVFSKLGDSKVNMVSRYEEGDAKGKVNYSEFTLAGQKFTAMESDMDHKFTFNEAISLYVECADQAEIDYLWEKLSADKASEQCGWLKDQYGVSWQIVPKRLGELANDPDQKKVNRVMQSLMPMKKISIADLEAAAISK